jgi:hypothetical protein
MSKLSKAKITKMQNSKLISPQGVKAMIKHAPNHTSLHNNLMIRSMELGVKFGEAHKRANKAVGK